jgi:hypothetical protein
VADHAVDLGIDQLLRHGRALLRIGRVIFRHQHEFDWLAVDLEALGVQSSMAILAAFSLSLPVGAGARDRGDVADLDDFLRARMAGKGEGDGERKDFGLEQHKHSPMDKDTAASREKPLRGAVRVRKGTTKNRRRKAAFRAFCILSQQSPK